MVPKMCCVVVVRYMEGSLQRSCVPIHEYPIFFFFLFLSLAGPVGCALGYDDLLFLFGCVCGCRSCGVVFWCIGGCVVVAGRVELFVGALDGVWWLQVALTHCAHCRPMGSIVVPP